MDSYDEYVSILLDMGDALLSCGAEIFRVEDTLNRMGYACGASEMNVFVITSTIVMTMVLPDGTSRTCTRRITGSGDNDFTRLEELNSLSRSFCAEPMSADDLKRSLRAVLDRKRFENSRIIGNILAAFSFALFFGGGPRDGMAAGMVALAVWCFQKYLRPVCMNDVTFQFVASFLTGFLICIITALFPVLHADKIMIGDIMLLIPGLMATNSLRDILIGDTLSGILRLIVAVLLASVLALGFISAIVLSRYIGI